MSKPAMDDSFDGAGSTDEDDEALYGHTTTTTTSSETEAALKAAASAAPHHEAIAQGLLPNGKRFDVPELVSVLRTVFHPASYRSSAVLFWFACCIGIEATLALYYTGTVGKAFYAWQFVFWRLAYNVGLGYILRVQSNSRAFDAFVRKHIVSSRFWTGVLENAVVFRDAKVPKYKVVNYPTEFTSWVVYRFVVMLILAMDCLGYFVMVWVYWDFPQQWTAFDIGRYVVGVALIVFGGWSKADAHRVIGDYAWYWGDFFFLLDKDLVFDGIFEMFPHPMYTVGYAFMYGFTIMSGSLEVFYLSLFGHFCQMAFLTFVENPHIDKTYNAIREPTEEQRKRDEILYNEKDGFFERRELVLLKNFTPFRTTDLILAMLLGYSALIGFVLSWEVAVAQYVGWRLLLTGVLGWALREQSLKRRWTRPETSPFKSPKQAFDNWKRLFNSSVVVTNACFLICAIRLFQWETIMVPRGITDAYSYESLRVLTIVVGLLCVSLNIYVSSGVYEALGDFGYYYGDFFIPDVPQRLNYSGIYRFLNNPDSSLGLAGYYGIALCSGSPLMVVLAIGSHVAIILFERLVEQPHMNRTHGADSIRKLGGLGKGIKDKASSVRRSLREKRRQAKAEYEKAVQKLRAEVAKKREALENATTAVSDASGAAARKKKR